MLEGDLGDFTLPDILRLLAFTSKSGRLTIATSTAWGHVDLAEGRVRQASADADRLALARRLVGLGRIDGQTLRDLLDGAGSLPTDLEFARELLARERLPADELGGILWEQTVDAVFELFRWPQGTFRFTARPPDEHADAPPVLAIVVDELLTEVASRLETWETIRERTGTDDAVVALARPGEATADLDADGWQLVGLVDGRRSVGDLVRLWGRGGFATRRMLAELLDRGAVSVSETGDDAEPGGIDRLIADQTVLAGIEDGLRPRSAQPPLRDRRPAREQEAPVTTTPPLRDGPERARVAPEVVTRRTTAPTVSDQDAERRGARGTPDAPGAGVPAERLRADPRISEDLVRRLIEGVEHL